MSLIFRLLNNEIRYEIDDRGKENKKMRARYCNICSLIESNTIIFSFFIRKDT